ncbi:erythromycin esterase family protein [Mucilaginibacter sp. UR6-11]|uniref:erythromycin esterase family protein n=1 Tax=Mucilaginibacter sp. UR6-11 TaxID=1435644 RepID=UPI001E3D3B9E|nr:erythromycin esterase family protein [Mucilaginibacter sp. UR6-11]MCC8426620.1 erythromycin esterase family protein [Mucilaginibacter sp. UR6-11]
MKHYLTREAPLDEPAIVASISRHAHPLENTADLQPLLDRIGDAKIVMLGEASHGTHEYYTWRAQISKILIREKGFNFIAVEGDWPDCYRLNRFVKGYDTDHKTAVKVLQEFNRWPTWMWANWEIAALAEWLKKYNTGLPANKKAGFYGLDVYSLWESMEYIMQYLQKTDPAALKVAENAYRCFEPYRKDEGRSYAHASAFVPELCQAEVVGLLKEIQRKLPQYNTDHENVFSAEQNAMIAVNAEKYYRAMISGGPNSWNIRDTHMANTLNRLLAFHGEGAKAIVWQHNTHIGDARATDMALEGMWNTGELARTQYKNKNVVLVGFGSYQGTVMAGQSWGAAMQVLQMPKARKASWEYLLHGAGEENKVLIMNDFSGDHMLMENHIGHRAIGVVYNSLHERYGNYVPTVVPLRYDAFIYLDKTTALHPLHIKPDGDQIPETYPFGV